ncbi:MULTISPECIES: hypothetical protein [unclassified Wolbachia]|uniref:hypothetical protein n=2 Tax=Wolbachia TaxID=953 RepID=UPI00222F4945|nr:MULTISPECIES: hypothetical protein [unclassified Wolbachia]
MAQTSQESVEKKFKDVFERSPGAFPEGTSLEEKVNYIAKGTEALKAVKNKELENKMENIAKLNKELEKRQKQNDEEIDKLRRSTQELRKEFGTSKRSRLGVIPQEVRQGTQTTEASVQTASEHDSQTVNPSVSKSSVKEKLNTELDKKDNTPQPQENQKEEGFLSLLKRFVKKILEKLLGEGEKDVENARGMKEDAQRDTSNNEEQQKSKQLDEILKDKSVSEGLKQATKLENPAITPVNTPKVNEVNTGRER